jgi:CRISPR-associated protein Cmr4
MAEGFILGLLAETPLHPGAGQSAGVVDLPVAREGVTGLPQIPETSVKGALRQWAESVYPGGKEDIAVKRLFGAPAVGEVDGETFGGAGALLISTARLLFLPVRRLDSIYAWVTTPYLLERLKRDAERMKGTLDVPTICVSNDNLMVTTDAGKRVFLEEYVFTTKAIEEDKTKAFGGLIGKLVADDVDDKPLVKRLTELVAVMDDGEFSWFAENALPVDARNSLDDSKMSTNLWYEATAFTHLVGLAGPAKS